MSNGASKTDERTQAYRKWLEQEIVDHFIGAHFRIGANKKSSISLHISRYIAGRALLFHIPYTMTYLFRYTSCIATEMKWMVVESAEGLRSEAVFTPFPLTKLSQFIPWNFLPKMVHAMGAHRLRQ